MTAGGALLPLPRCSRPVLRGDPRRAGKVNVDRLVDDAVAAVNSLDAGRSFAPTPVSEGLAKPTHPYHAAAEEFFRSEAERLCEFQPDTSPQEAFGTIMHGVDYMQDSGACAPLDASLLSLRQAGQ